MQHAVAVAHRRFERTFLVGAEVEKDIVVPRFDEMRREELFYRTIFFAEWLPRAVAIEANEMTEL